VRDVEREREENLSMCAWGLDPGAVVVCILRDNSLRDDSQANLRITRIIPRTTISVHKI
jgi:hypothetical protein